MTISKLLSAHILVISGAGEIPPLQLDSTFYIHRAIPYNFADTLHFIFYRFTWRMKMLTGRRGVVILYAYMLLGLGFLRSITPNFGALSSQEQQLEGLFRYVHGSWKLGYIL